MVTFIQSKKLQIY